MAGQMNAPRLRVREVALFEREVKLRLPFRFGIVTLRQAPQAFVRLGIAIEGGASGIGMAAELMAPKWFDKTPTLSNEQNFDQLRLSLHHAAAAYLSEARALSAFALSAAHHGPLVEAGRTAGLNPLVAAYGPALLDRAVADALCRATGRSFPEAVQGNHLGLAAEPLAADLAGFDLDGFLGTLHPAPHIDARHTVGLVDPITAAGRPDGERIDDGLPETLEEVVAAYRHRCFKLKVGGTLEADIERLTAIAAVLDRAEQPYAATLDGNEQYTDVDQAVALWRAIAERPALRRLASSVLFIEQPVKREAALSRDVSALARCRPVIIDESDADYDAFLRARSLGYRGVSSKTCKGFYKSLLNAARAARWNAESGGGFFLSGEDLTTQAGLAVQQDLALVAVLGLTHVERNGHHYVDGFAGAPAAEQERFLAAHPDLYRRADARVRLSITDGRIALGSVLQARGFASGAGPDWDAMRPLARPQCSLTEESRP